MCFRTRNSQRGPLAFLLAVSLLCCIVLPNSAPAADNRFHEHRARVLHGKANVTLVQGRVIGTRGDDRLLTSIATPRLTSKGFSDLDNVWVHVGRHKMLARIMSDATFRTLTSDEQSMRNLDVDVICLLGDDRGQPGMEIVGLGGALVAWLKPQATTHVVVEKVQY